MADAVCSADNLGFPWPSAWGTSGVLKIISDREFVSNGKPYLAGRISDPINQNFCYQSAITVVGGAATFAAITLPQTDAADVQVVNGSGTPLYTAIIYSNGGNSKQRNLFSSWHLSSSLGTSFNFAAWTTDNNAPTAINPRSSWVDTDTLNRALAAIAYAPASATQNGLIEVDVAPADTAHPVAVGLNSRRTLSFYNVKATAIGVIGDGVTDDRAALNTLVNTTLQISGAGGDVYFPAGTYLIGSNVTFPANVRLVLDPRATLKPANGVTITDLTDHSSWDSNQKFTNALSGQGTISLSRLAMPEWWATNTTPGTTDMTTAIQAAIAAVTGIGILRLSSTDYKITASLIGASNLWIDGEGYTTRIFNAASASKPTFVFTSKQNFRLSNFSIIGQSANPNDGMKFDTSAYFDVDNVLINANGKGVHLINVSTVTLSHVSYWPSGFANGATGSALQRLNAVLADSSYANNVHIDHLDVGYVESIADGGADIRWNTTFSQDIWISGSHIEGVGLRSVDLSGVYNATIGPGNYIDNTNTRVLACREVSIYGNYGGSATTYTVGDGTAPNACLNVIVKDAASGSLSIDSQALGCGAENSVFETAPGYVNAGTARHAINVRSTGGTLVADEVGTVGQKWYDHAVAEGTGTATTYASGDYTSIGGGTTFVVDSGDLTAGGNKYTLIGKRMTVDFFLSTTTITGTPSALNIKIPGSFIANERVSVGYWLSNNGGAYSRSEATVLGIGATVITLYAVPNGGSNFAAGADNNYLRGSITFEVQ